MADGWRATLAWRSAAVVGLAILCDLVVWDADRVLRDGRLLPMFVVPVLTVLVHLTLLQRRRRPWTAFGVEWGFAVLANLVLPAFQPFAGLLFALHAVASRRPVREAALALVLAIAAFAVHSHSTAATHTGEQARSFLFLMLFWLPVTAAVWGVGRVAHASARRSWHLRELQAAEAEEAVDAERARLARELHDIVSHAVTGMTLQAAGAQALLRPNDARVRQSLATIEAAGVQAMSELHRMLGLLQPGDPGAPPGTTGPRVADIAALVGLADAAGRDVHLVQDGDPGPLDPSVETAAYRIVQEGLTNSAKHAGSAVAVRLHWLDDELEVSVQDRGRGRALPDDRRAQLSSGSGLRGLTERVLLIGGTLDAGLTEDGFGLVARLPRPRQRAPRSPVDLPS